ncbi:TBC1 domain family member 5 homolog A-like [Chenopodium quinoa]|uniref:TBC1 domain family member 5 homolog A-like n=1 Tax=Chenopodium quinoa TaxID=63459 RepID=UPI000B76BFE0|nr:TBC1 domain family member 5 homolog A-like [Chenopodium quinoa]
MNKTEEDVVDIIEDLRIFDAQRNVGNRNYHNQVNYDNYNQNSGYRNHGIQEICGSYNNHCYNGQSHGQGYGDYNKGYGNHNNDCGQNQCRGNWNSQSRGNLQSNVQRVTTLGFIPNAQGQSDKFYDQPFSSRSFLEDVIEKQAKLLNTYITLSNEKFNDMLTYHRGLETQISQLASEFKEFTNLPSLNSPILDPKSPTNAIVTRSGRVRKSEDSKKSDAKESPRKVQMENEGNENTLVEEVNKEQVEKVKEREREVYKPKLPYPKKFNRHKLDEQYGKFIEMLRQLHLTLPFTDVIEQMPNYANFLKEILSGKRTCDAVKTINLTENCSAIIMNKIPPKLKDPKNFFIPCAI